MESSHQMLGSHLFASLFRWGDGMAMMEMIAGYAFVFLVLSLIVRGIAGKTQLKIWSARYILRDERKKL